MTIEFSVDEFVKHVVELAAATSAGHRRVVALAGAPASGKSSTADRIVERANVAEPGSAALLPLDGFHFDDEVLNARGWRARKGAPHTFDVGGYASALRRVRANEPSVAVPRFDRDLEIARAGAIIIEPTVRLVVTEGNWLLLDDEPWSELGELFDHTAMVMTNADTLGQRLRDRWVSQDYTAEMIRTKLEDNDLPNARLVTERSVAPDWVVRT